MVVAGGAAAAEGVVQQVDSGHSGADFGGLPDVVGGEEVEGAAVAEEPQLDRVQPRGPFVFVLQRFDRDAQFFVAFLQNLSDSATRPQRRLLVVSRPARVLNADAFVPGFEQEFEGALAGGAEEVGEVCGRVWG